MDRETATMIVNALGGHVISGCGQTAVCGLSAQGEDIFDILEIDFEEIALDEKVSEVIRDPYVTDKKTEEALLKSSFWRMFPCPTLDTRTMDILEDALGAVVIKKDHASEVWLRVGPEHPIFLGSGRQRAMQALFPGTALKAPLCAILVEDSALKYRMWDFATFDGTNWQAHQNGTITGLTKKVVHSVELPDTMEVIESGTANDGH